MFVQRTGLRAPAEPQLAQGWPPLKRRDLIKPVRAHRLESARPILEEFIRQATGAAP